MRRSRKKRRLQQFKGRQRNLNFGTALLIVFMWRANFTEVETTISTKKLYFPHYLDVKISALTEHHSIKAYWGSGGIAPLIL